MWNKEKVRKLKIALWSMTAVIFACYLLNKLVLYNRFDTSYPEITFDQDVIEVSVNATEEELLQGVTAFDKKDGDITDSIIVEKMSNLLEGNQRIVTYVAFDGDNHVGKAERKIKYTDYTPIRFSMAKSIDTVSMQTASGEVMNAVRAIDCVDGDITENILMDGNEMVEMLDGSISTIYKFQVSNSCGDIATLTLPIQISDTTVQKINQNAEILLSNYLIYTKVGQKVDLNAVISKVYVNDEQVGKENVKITTDLNVLTPGVYKVTYSVKEAYARATSCLYVVVEE